jgi:predicted permease
MDRLYSDLSYAFRTLRRSPGFCAVAVVSLALGIGANSAIYSLIHALMLRSLPVDHPEQLVLLTDPNDGFLAVDTTIGGDRPLLAYPEFEALRAANKVFSGMAAMDSTAEETEVRLEISGAQQRLRARAQLVSGEFFPLLGVHAVIGRVFTPDEDRVRGANPIAVISHAFWQRQFAGDPGAIGKTLLVGRNGFRIIGVTPPEFQGALVGFPIDFWAPLTMQAALIPGHDYLTPRDTLWLQVFGRLAPGVSRATAQAGVNVAFQQLLQGWAGSLPTPEERRRFVDQRIMLRDGARGSSEVRDRFADPLIFMMGMVGVVLLIACANIANLTLARATGRRREIGVRLALGAARGQLIRQLITESLVIACLGGALGALLSIWGSDLLTAIASAGTSGFALTGQRDPKVLAFTAAVSLATVLLFGLLPAIRATRVDVNCLLAAGARGAIGVRGAARRGRALVVAQVALSVLLLMSAALLVRSLNRLTGAKVGFDRNHLVIARLDPNGAGYQGASLWPFYLQLRERLAQIRGVRAVTFSDKNPYDGDSGDHISVEGVHDRPERDMSSSWSLVGPDYFAAMGIPLVRGREISADDVARGRAVCVVNRSFAEFYFPNADPIGKHVTDEYPTTRTTFEIIGVSADAREQHLSGLSRPRRFYGSIAHPIGTITGLTALVRTQTAPSGFVEPVRKALAAHDPMLPVLGIRTVNAQIERSLAAERTMAQMAAIFGGLALAMAAVGLYGLLSYSIGRRTGEIGLRMALGASGRGVVAMVMRETLLLLGMGILLGVPAAIGAAKLMRGMLAGMSPADPLSIAVSVAVIAATGALAAWNPARRAAAIDPMAALRVE